MRRREFCLALPAFALATDAFAHHGWSSFDDTRPLYFEGKVSALKWQNPHVELMITLGADLSLPMDLSKRKWPAQSQPMDGMKLAARATLPKARGQWELELSPLTRVEAWKVTKPKIGDVVAAIGYTFKDEKKHDGQHIARVEYFIVGENIYGLRSLPA